MHQIARHLGLMICVFIDLTLGTGADDIHLSAHPPPPLRRKSAWRYSGSDEWRRARYWHRGLLSHVLAKSLVGVDRAFLYVTVTL
jgi:hypothetical protein